MAMIWNANILIWATSKLNCMKQQGLIAGARRSWMLGWGSSPADANYRGFTHPPESISARRRAILDSERHPVRDNRSKHLAFAHVLLGV